MSWISANRMKLEKHFLDSKQRKYISPAYYGQYQITLERIKKYAHGRVIDLGCGDMPYRQYIEGQIEVYDSLDYIPRTEEVKYVSDIQDMSILENEMYDTAICLEVLEHITDPSLAVREIYRILKKNGILVLSVPHLSRLHEIPHDYYRYTCYGIEHLLKSAGFTVVSIEERGGLFSFLGHQISLIFLSIIWGIPVIRDVGFVVNALFVSRLLFWLDKQIKLGNLFPLGYAVVAKK